MPKIEFQEEKNQQEEKNEIQEEKNQQKILIEHVLNSKL